MSYQNVIADFNLMSVEDMDSLLFSPYQQALGKQTWQRMQQQIRNYQYYEGKQHVDPRTGQLVKASELPRPNGLDYDPTRYATNYFKSFVQRKARWQMGGQHNIVVNPQQIDDPIEAVAEDYEPSPAQQAEIERANGYQKLLNQLWRENKMREKLLQASRDRLIAGRVGCKIMFNNRTGKLHWVFRPDTEIVPVYSDDDFEELIAVHFVQEKEDANGEGFIYKQTFSMEEDGFCYLHEANFDYHLRLINEITPKQSMGIDFIPVVLFPIQDLSGEDVCNTEAEDLKEQNDILNQLNEDAIDSLKFEMFSMTALINVPEGTANKVSISPGSVIEAQSGMNGQTPDIKKVEGGFRWKDAHKETYARVKGAMHEISGLPNIVPQELNFGGLNGDALQVLFHTIIQETEEHWLVWQDRLQELHEKSIRYLQARVTRPKFGYDKEVVRNIGENYENEIKFQLPLPENRADLVELLTIETTSGFESIQGAMQRLGVENVHVKKQEIANEKTKLRSSLDPYGGMFGGGGGGNPEDELDDLDSGNGDGATE